MIHHLKIRKNFTFFGINILLSLFCFVFIPDIMAGNEKEDPLLIQRVVVGIDGVYKNGFWTPIQVESRDFPGFIELETVDSDGTPCKIREKRISSPQTLYIPLGRSLEELTVRLITNDQKVLAQKVLAPSHRKSGSASGKGNSTLFTLPETAQRPICLIIGKENIGLQEAMGELRLKEDHRPRIHKISTFSDLPDKEIGYESVDMIILTTTDSQILEGINKDDIRIQALSNWVRSGGRLFLLAGKGSLPYLSGQGAFADFVPGVPGKDLQEIRIANALVRYVPKAKNLVMTGSLDAPFLEVPQLRDLDPNARVEIAEMETPFLIRSPYGLGSVTFFTGDLSEAPLAKWSGRSGLIVRLFGFDPEKINAKTSDHLLVQQGYTDLSGQIRSALDIFDGVWNIPFSLILGLIFLYILLIGPFDWYLTHHLLKKPNGTWITFPIFILIFVGLSIWLSHKGNPQDLRINRLDLLDIDQENDFIRGTSWMGIYSPRDSRLDLKLFPHSDSRSKFDLKIDDCRLCWLGLQGSALGGMSPKTISPRFWKDPYQLGDPESELNDLPIQVRSSKSLLGRWSGSIKGLEKSDLHLFDEIPIGKLRNPFDTPIYNGILLYGRWALNVGTLEPGTTKEITIKTPRTERHLVLGTTRDPFQETNHSVIQKGLQQYDSRSTNLPYIARTMMFYRLAGGFSAIGLDNSYQHYIDLSETLLNGRAVLIGTIKDPSADDQNTPSDLLPVQIDLQHKDPNGKWSVFPEKTKQTILIRMICPVRKKLDKE